MAVDVLIYFRPVVLNSLRVDGVMVNGTSFGNLEWFWAKRERERRIVGGS